MVQRYNVQQNNICQRSQSILNMCYNYRREIKTLSSGTSTYVHLYGHSVRADMRVLKVQTHQPLSVTRVLIAWHTAEQPPFGSSIATRAIYSNNNMQIAGMPPLILI